MELLNLNNFFDHKEESKFLKIAIFPATLFIAQTFLYIWDSLCKSIQYFQYFNKLIACLLEQMNFANIFEGKKIYVPQIINSFIAKDSKFLKESVQVETCSWIYLEISTIFQNHFVDMGSGNSGMYLLPFTMDEFQASSPQN